MNKKQGMNKTPGSGISQDIQILSLIAVLMWFAFILLQHRSIFPDNWFPSHFEASTFMILFCAWILSEITNSIWSRKNSMTTNQDKGSYRIVVATCWIVLIIVFVSHSFGIGIFSGGLQYVGLILLVVGIVLREWSI